MIASLIIVCVMVSRIYLGLHSFAQVLGGLFFGIVIVKISLSNFGNNVFDLWTKGQTRTYWTTVLITVLISCITSKIIMPLVFGITGILAGYGLCLGITERYINTPKAQSRFLCGSAGAALIWMVNYIFPKVHFEQVAVADVIFIVKYFLVSLIIFGLIPYFQLKSKKL